MVDIYIHTISLQDMEIFTFLQETHTDFSSQRNISHKFDNLGWFSHVFVTGEPIRVERIFQQPKFYYPNLKLFISDNILVFIDIPQLK